MIQLEPADVLCFSSGSFQSKVIRWFEERPGNPAIYNHCGICVSPGTWWTAQIVESLLKDEKHSVASNYAGSTTKVSVFRPIGLTDGQKEEIASKALSYVGGFYNFGMLPLQAADGLLGKIFRHRILFFRYLASPTLGNICSVLVTRAYYEAVQWEFGLEPYAADPDDVGDYCENSNNEFSTVCHLVTVPSVPPSAVGPTERGSK